MYWECPSCMSSGPDKIKSIHYDDNDDTFHVTCSICTTSSVFKYVAPMSSEEVNKFIANTKTDLLDIYRRIEALER